MEAETIIPYVIAIVSLAVVFGLFLIFKGTEVDSTTCELSVLTRATTEAGQGYIPLKCQTEKLCLSDGSGDRKCGNNFIGEKIVPENLDKDIVKSAGEANEIFAGKMYDCWNMMGQGKLSLFTKGMLDYHGLDGTKKVTCVICSRIAVEHSSSKEVFNQMNLENYLATEKIPGQAVTYLQAFTDKQFNSFPSVRGIDEKKIEQIEKTAGGVEFADSGNSQMAVVFTQIAVPEPGEVIKRLADTGAGIFVGGSFVLGLGNVVKVVASKVVIIPMIIAGGTITAISMADNYESRIAAAGYCGQFTTTYGGDKDKLKNGCSTVMVVPYDADTINQICTGGYEGSP